METKICIVGEFTKEQLAELIRKLAEIQKKINPKNKIEKQFLIWISNDAYSDDEVRKLIRKNFKDFKVTDLVEESGNEVLKAMSKKSAS